MSEPGSVSLNGHLRLVCSQDDHQRTYVSQQAFRAPLHLSKTYWNGQTLLIHVINQTAGVFGGDQILTDITVQTGACVLLSSPSATRFHPSQERESHLEQKITVQAGGCLDIYPEITIPHRNSRSFQKTSITVEPGGELIYLETLTPGRVASGETFAYTSYRWWTDITLGPRLIHRERARLSPQDQSLQGLKILHSSSYYAGLIIVSPEAEKWPIDFAHEVKARGDLSNARVGASKLSTGGWSIRLLASDSLGLRQGVAGIRNLLYQRLGRTCPDLRRL